MGPPIGAEVLRVLYWNAHLRRVPVGTRRPVGAVPQALSWRRRRKFCEVGPEEADLGVIWGGAGQKMEFDGQLGPTRSRQDASIECYIGGSTRPSSGCNGVHVLWLKPLIWRSLF